MQNKKRTYTLFGTSSAPIIAAGNYSLTFELNFRGEFKVKSIIYDLNLFDWVTKELLPISQGGNVASGLNVGTNALRPVGYPFENITASFPADTGKGIMMLQPGQIFLDALIISNTLDFQIYFENKNPFTDIGFEVAVTCEIEIIDK